MYSPGQGRGRGRGGYAPRRGGGSNQPYFRGGSNRPFFKSKEQTMPDTQKYPLGELLEGFRNVDLEVERDDAFNGSAISGCQYVASYNWLSEKVPTIIVPGNFPNHTVEAILKIF